jgi:peroxiredoxin
VLDRRRRTPAIEVALERVDRQLKGERMLNPGDKAPDFTGRDHNGNPVRLADFKGKTVVLWFYPKADTPG